MNTPGKKRSDPNGKGACYERLVLETLVLFLCNNNSKFPLNALSDYPRKSEGSLFSEPLDYQVRYINECYDMHM